MPHTLTWLGHSNFRIDTASGSTLLIDPFFEGNPKSPTPWKDLGTVDAVLVTHDHGDHVGQAVEICRDTGAALVAVVGTAGKLMEAGVPQAQIVGGVGMNIGGTVEVAGVRATMTQAVHSTDSGACAGYIVDLGDFVLYHAGDTGVMASMGLLGELYDIDLALLPIGGHFTMDARQAALACRLLSCKAVTPMHWGTFPVLEQNTQAFAAALEQFSPSTRLAVMEPGAPVTLVRGQLA